MSNHLLTYIRFLMRRVYYQIVTIFLLCLFTGKASLALPESANCLKVKIFSQKRALSFSDRHTFVIHFQLENCSENYLPIDFYGNLGYPTDSTCNIYFQIQKFDGNGRFKDYAYTKVDYKNTIDSMMRLKPHGIYLFYLPLFEVYDIKEPGVYRIQGFYRYIDDKGQYFIQKSEFLDISVNK